ncbi:MAG: tetratricopeptide repeat protein [Rhodothermales bacterium]|nr:tetratricopeptide repeat protein [Rhodothermales bacterium]
MFLLLAACQAQPETAVGDQIPVRPAADFVGDAVCATCHESEAASYAAHGMANSFYPMSPDRVVETFDSPVVRHEASDFFYRAFREGDRFYQEEYRLEADGSRSHELIREVTHVVGSAQAARTYVSERNGRFDELPLTWYSQESRWDFSPGYREANLRFDRKLTSRCMACHTNAPPVLDGTDQVFEATPLAISCERCHGGGDLHVQARRAVPEPAGDTDPTIFNPDHVELDLRMDVCQQCHLNGAIVVYRDGSDPYSFRPGDRLVDHQLLFEPAHETGLAVISHADRLKQSACYLETLDSPSPLECTTCHNPHADFRTAGNDFFNATCRPCHVGVAQEVPDFARADHVETSDCASCHMQKRQVENAPHSSFTDHFIRASIPADEVESAETVEEPLVLEPVYGEAEPGELAWAYLSYGYARGARDVVDRGLILAERELPWFRAAGNSNAAFTLAKSLLWSGRPQDAVEFFRLAVAADTSDAERLLGLSRALDDLGEQEEANVYYNKAHQSSPRSMNVLKDFANFLIRTNREDGAVRLYSRAVAEDPGDAAAANGLAAALSRLGRVEEALQAAESAVANDPDYVDGMTNVGLLRARLGDLDGALEVLRPAALLGRDTGNLSPILNLGLVSLEAGEHEESIRMLGLMVASNPEQPDMRVLLARAMMAKGDSISALAQINAALNANPGHPAATEIKNLIESR